MRALPWMHGAALAALVAGCADAPTHAPPAARAPNLAVIDAARGGPAGFYWLTPTVLAQPATFPEAFDAAAAPEVAVELCALDAAGTACAGVPVARYTATTAPSAQQVRVDAVREAYTVYWNTAASAGEAVAAGRTYRARVLRGAGGAARELGAIDVRVVATAAEAGAVDRTRFAAVVRGQQLALRFRVERPAAAEAPVPAAHVRAAAEALYAAVRAGDSAAVVSETRNLFGAAIPIFDLPNERTAVQLARQGLAVGLGLQAALVARSLRGGLRATVPSFVAAAAAAGVTVSATGAPVTTAALESALRPLVGKASYAPEELVGAIVLALGQARAAQGGAAPADPIWGDGHLDALQTTLLTYAVFLSGDLPAASAPTASAPPRAATDVDADPRPPAARAAAPPPAPKQPLPQTPAGFRQVVNRTGKSIFGAALGIPITPVGGVIASVCGSVAMNSYKFSVTGTPTQLGRRGLDRPTQSDITARLVYDFVPNEIGEWVFGDGGLCPTRPNGPASGVRTLWRRSGGIVAHTNENLSESFETDAGGVATARLTTREEVVPSAFRTLAREATGTVTVRAIGLMPGLHGLEFGVGGGVMNPTEAGVRYSVKHYEWPSALDADFTVALRGQALYPGTQWAVGQRASSMRLHRTDHGDAMEYYGTGPVAYTHFRIEGNTNPTGCPLATRHTVSGQLGYAVVATRAGEDADGSVLGMPEVVEPFSIEHFAFECPPPRGTIPSSVGGFGLLLAAVYGPIDPGPFRHLSKNPVTEWQVVSPGVLRGVQSRAVPTVIGPVDEVSTVTLRMVP